MTQPVTYDRRDDVGVIRIDQPPVNALGQAVREALVEAIDQARADTAARAVLVIGNTTGFSAGADIREFGQPPAGPALPDVIAALEALGKPVVAAIRGVALGGGLELALGCHYRLARPDARLGLPEVSLGLLPGAGGTQRLPRLIGIQAALERIVTGQPVDGGSAQAVGLVDALIVDKDFETAALAYTRGLIPTDAGPRPLSARSCPRPDDAVYEQAESLIPRRLRGLAAPKACIQAVRAAARDAFDQGMAHERALFAELLASPESAAQRHVFFAEREAAKVHGVSRDTPHRAVERVAVIGAGTMGAGIAMNFLSAGLPVTLLEAEQSALDRGVARIRGLYEASASRGRIDAAEVETLMARLSTTLDYQALSTADLIIEAVFENMAIKQEVFARLDAVARDGAILATNTSTLDVDAIAGATQRPADVIGLHFFSPANVMTLLEVVRGQETAADVLATVMALARRVGKVAVCVGVCDGFVGNRMLHVRQDQALALVADGARPVDIDRVITDFGLPMGPFAMWDLAGLDIIHRIREGQREHSPDHAPERDWIDALVDEGRLGQKTGGGVFDYAQGDRRPRPASATDALIAADRQRHARPQRTIEAEEIRERCLYAMINEGARILEEGIAARPGDIDVVWIHGYGWPVARGGPMYWADRIGTAHVLARLRAHHEATGADVFVPSPLLVRLAEAGQGFADA